ncbi:MAG: pyridoxal-phosphate dependent enzyme [Saprospiraceae bacterium]|nr:pyridoxal-phosphate dependent enzyme [Saprospiraceae bacterium]
MNLRDASGDLHSKVSAEARGLAAVVQNHATPLTERLAAFGDIINLEVGDTSLVRSRNIERDHGLRQVFLKIEGDNPTGTQKDRIGFAQVYDAMRRGFDVISLATCGNYGVSIALAAHLAGLKCRIYIPESYHSRRMDEMRRLGAMIKLLPGGYEESVRRSSALARRYGWYDANPGGDNTALQIRAYEEIANELYDQLRDAPRVCALPVSNGTLLAGVYRGFVALYKRGKTSRIPRIVGASSTFKNPIIHSFNKGLDTCVDLRPEQIRETNVNEPLINWHSFDGQEALTAIRQSGGAAFNVNDQEMRRMSTYLRRTEGKGVLPASTAGLIGLLRLHEREPCEPDRYVAVLTARV